MRTRCARSPYARTYHSMQAAFGPYCDHRLLPMQEPRKPRRAARFLRSLVSILKHRKVSL